ncbi:MAG: hypothetical protein ACR2M6_03740 [Vampirovibrionia bacterium]
MSAGSSFTNFVTEGNVRQNAQDFNPLLYSKGGAITGYPGPNTGIAAAAGNPGPKIVPVMNGGRKTAPGPDYHSFVDSDDLRAGVYGRNLAPVKSCNNNMCGGKKSKKGKKGKKGNMTASRKSDKKKRVIKTPKKMLSKSSQKKTKKGKGSSKSGMKRVRKATRKYLKDVGGFFGLKGGDPATVPSGSHNDGYHQYMNNQPFSNSYSAGGHLAPVENALANPVLIRPTDNCPPQK